MNLLPVFKPLTLKEPELEVRYPPGRPAVSDPSLLVSKHSPASQQLSWCRVYFKENLKPLSKLYGKWPMCASGLTASRWDLSFWESPIQELILLAK